MEILDISEYRSRFDAVLSREVLTHAIKKEISISLKTQDEEYFSKILHSKLDSETPFIILDSLIPTEGNALAAKKTEFAATCDYISKGVVYHARFHLIVWGVGEHKGMTIVYATPPLDTKIATEEFSSRPGEYDPLWVKIPLFKTELRLPVTQISYRSLVFEDRLVSDSMPALEKLGRITLEFDNGEEIIIHGQYHGKGGQAIEFKYEDNDEEDLNRIDQYLISVFTTRSLRKTAKDDSKRRGAVKKAVENQIKILMYAKDKDYAKSLQEMFELHDAQMAFIDDLEKFLGALQKYLIDIVLIDNSDSDIDLWEVARSVHGILQMKQKQPPVILLSDDLSEDAVVYAQYCNINHIYSREVFKVSACNVLAPLVSLQSWHCKGDENTRKKVLIIDDDQNLIFPLNHGLSQLGYEVLVAKTGSEGLRLAKEHRPDCIILELALRSGDGITVCRMLRKVPFTSKIPIAVLTISKDKSDYEAVKPFNVQKYLNKPMANHEIINLIQEIVENQ